MIAPGEEPPPPRIDVHVPWATIGKLALAAALAWAAGILAPLAMTLLLAVLLATSLHPVVVWIERRGLPRGWGVLLVGTALIAAVSAFLVLVIPPIVGQASAIGERLPELRDQALAGVPEGAARSLLEQALAGGAGGGKPMVQHAIGLGRTAVDGLLEVGMVLVFAIYLLLDGPGVLRWLVAFVPSRHRARVHETAQEMAPVVFAYVAGQVITSALCTAATFVVLAALHVPAALLLAVLAGVCDVLPVVGFIISAAPAVGLAATVSPSCALIVLGFYVLYNAIENYAIVPYVYGTRLRLSTLTVLVTLLASYLVGGVAGAIAVLPLVASYPIIERRWLAPWLHPDTVRSHDRLEREAAGAEQR